MLMADNESYSNQSDHAFSIPFNLEVFTPTQTIEQWAATISYGRSNSSSINCPLLQRTTWSPQNRRTLHYDGTLTYLQRDRERASHLSRPRPRAMNKKLDHKTKNKTEKTHVKQHFVIGYEIDIEETFCRICRSELCDGEKFWPKNWII